MEKKAEKKEEERKNWTLRELLEESGRVYDNPVLRAKIEAAPSPKAADEHMLRLGWPTELAKKVRHAVRLKQLFPEVWKEIIKTNIRPADSLCYFFEKYKAFPSHDIRVNTELSFDEWRADRGDWPFFLKSFSYWDEHGLVLSTIDGDGTQSISVYDADDSNLIFDFGHGESECHAWTEEMEFKFFRHYAMHHFELKIPEMKRLLVYVKPLLLTSKGGKFPRFCKVIELNDYFCSQGYSKVRIIAFEDYGPKDNGEDFSNSVTFEKVVAISEGRVAAKLSVKYDFCWADKMLFRKNSGSPISVFFVSFGMTDGWRENPNPTSGDFNQTRVANVMGELAELAGKIYSKTEKIALEDIAGLRLLERKPKELSDLFV